MTAWLKILGKGAPEAPMLKVNFVRTRESLRSVSAQVCPLVPAPCCWMCYLYRGRLVNLNGRWFRALPLAWLSVRSPALSEVIGQLSLPPNH